MEYANGHGDEHGEVHVGGNVTAETYNGYAEGVGRRPPANITVGGSVYALSVWPGVGASTPHHESTNTHVVRRRFGQGLQRQSHRRLLVGREHQLRQHRHRWRQRERLRPNNGIGVYAVGGNVNVHVGGDVTAVGFYAATGVSHDRRRHGLCGRNARPLARQRHRRLRQLDRLHGRTVKGDVTAESVFLNATGISTYSFDYTHIYVGGNVHATTTYGEAVGVKAYADDTIGITVNGNVYAGSYRGNASGLLVDAEDGQANISIGGSVIAKSTYGNATGIFSYSYDDTHVNIGGSLYAASKYGYAVGGKFSADDSITANITGDVTAKSTYGFAVGVEAYAVDDIGNDYTLTVNVGGNVTALCAPAPTALRSLTSPARATTW